MPEEPPPPDESTLRVAVEATSLLGPRTGVGTMTDALLVRLARRPDLDLTAVLVSRRGRGLLEERLPAGTASLTVATPARLSHLLWERSDRPALRGFDVVHGPNFVVPPARGAAELITVHDFGPWHNPERVDAHARRYPRLVARALARGAHVHTVSHFVADEAADLLGVEAARVTTIANGFTAGPAGDPGRGRDLVGGPYVLAVGTIEPRKGHPTLVEAMAAVWEEHPDVRLAVAGADGWGSEAFEAAIARVGAGDRVVRLGYVSEAQRSDLFAGARCLAFPSRYEGFGLPPLEAMAAGCPVVASTAGALPEVCGDAARLVAPDQPTDLGAALVEVIGDEELRGRLVEAGLANVARFSWDRSADAMAALYRRLGAHSEAGPRR